LNFNSPTSQRSGGPHKLNIADRDLIPMSKDNWTSCDRSGGDECAASSVGRDRGVFLNYFYRRSQRTLRDWCRLAQNFQAGSVFAFDNRNSNRSSRSWCKTISRTAARPAVAPYLKVQILRDVGIKTRLARAETGSGACRRVLGVPRACMAHAGLCRGGRPAFS